MTAICDKCGSEDISFTDVTPERGLPPPMKMSEWHVPTTMTLEYRVHTTRLTCKRCGFSVDKTR